MHLFYLFPAFPGPKATPKLGHPVKCSSPEFCHLAASPQSGKMGHLDLQVPGGLLWEKQKSCDSWQRPQENPHTREVSFFPSSVLFITLWTFSALVIFFADLFPKSKTFLLDF